MIVWGGGRNPAVLERRRALQSGGQQLDGGAKHRRARRARVHTAVWTGSEMIVFGGYGNDGPLSDTWSYYPYAPAVRISRAGPTSAVVAWPVWHPTLRLCQTTNLTAGQWTTVTNDVTQVGSENRVTVSPLATGSSSGRSIPDQKLHRYMVTRFIL